LTSLVAGDGFAAEPLEIGGFCEKKSCRHRSLKISSSQSGLLLEHDPENAEDPLFRKDHA
jgi:hypothetical protein